MEMTLLVLAAGMGSRYGGLKQMDPVGPSGETLLDYSVFDAMRAGFARVVFVIRRDFEEEFREKVGRRFEDRLNVGYVFQQLNDLPEGFNVPEGRVKPWGTGHAVWCARGAVDGPFLAINADDFYGRAAIAGVGDFLTAQAPDAENFCMAGYRLDATLSGSGVVSRGLCDISGDGWLSGVREFTKIGRADGAIRDMAGGADFRGDECVSLNCWGFTPRVFQWLEDFFSAFLEARGTGEKAEYYIPEAVAGMVASGQVRVRVLPVESPWFGITYQGDRTQVVDALADLVEKKIYPSPLWD